VSPEYNINIESASIKIQYPKNIFYCWNYIKKIWVGAFFLSRKTLLRLGFNEVAQFLSESEVLAALSVFSSPYFFHQYYF
jgi:hypothetical protein